MRIPQPVENELTSVLLHGSLLVAGQPCCLRSGSAAHLSRSPDRGRGSSPIQRRGPQADRPGAAYRSDRVTRLMERRRRPDFAAIASSCSSIIRRAGSSPSCGLIAIKTAHHRDGDAAVGGAGAILVENIEWT